MNPGEADPVRNRVADCALATSAARMTLRSARARHLLFCLAPLLGGVSACRSRPAEAPRPESERLLASAVERLAAGFPTEALTLHDRAVEPAPGDLEARRQRAHCRVRLGMDLEALEDLDRALALGADDAWTHYVRGVGLRATGDAPGAIASFTLALERDPGHSPGPSWPAGRGSR